MKSILVNYFKGLGMRKIEGKKVELYSFYQLVGFKKRMDKGEVLK